MQTEKIRRLKSEEVGEMEGAIEKQYGGRIDLTGHIVFQIDDELRIISGKLQELDMNGIEINFLGLNIGKFRKDGSIQLSIEGTQLAGKTASRNIVILDEKNTTKFIQGFDAEPDEKIFSEEGSLQLLKYQGDFLGSGKLVAGKILNATPKNRRTLFTSGRIT